MSALLVALVVAAACRSAPATPTPSAEPTGSPSAVTATPTTASESPEVDGEGFDAGRVRLGLRPVATGLASPLLVTTAGDGSDRLFVVEQTGRIRIVEGERVLPSPFLDVSDRIVAGGEQGLLGLAFHPDYETNGRFFVNYTDRNGDTVVSEFAASDDPDLAAAGSERVLLQIDQPFTNHNGGNLVFGPDGDLYIGMGDGGSGGDPMGNGQSLDTLLGKMLRIDVDAGNGDGPYGIPSDNPFVDRDGARPEIWALGLRNPWRFSFDRDTGDLWIGDVGQGAFEEIDRVAGDQAGVDYGWNVMEGRSCFLPSSGCDTSGLTLPVAVYDHAEGCSVTGGFVYRGDRWPALEGAYLFADFCSGTIWGLDAADPRRRPPQVLLETDRSLSSFGQDDAGELYVTDLTGGEVLRILAPEPS